MFSVDTVWVTVGAGSSRVPSGAAVAGGGGLSVGGSMGLGNGVTLGAARDGSSVTGVIDLAGARTVPAGRVESLDTVITAKTITASRKIPRPPARTTLGDR